MSIIRHRKTYYITYMLNGILKKCYCICNTLKEAISRILECERIFLNSDGSNFKLIDYKITYTMSV